MKYVLVKKIETLIENEQKNYIYIVCGCMITKLLCILILHFSNINFIVTYRAHSVKIIKSNKINICNLESNSKNCFALKFPRQNNNVNKLRNYNIQTTDTQKIKYRPHLHNIFEEISRHVIHIFRFRIRTNGHPNLQYMIHSNL